MRILLVCAVLVALITCRAAEAHHRPGPCSIHWKTRDRDEARDSARRLIRCAVRRWPVPGDYTVARDVARCESGLRWWADGGINDGLYQHDIRYWPARADHYLRDRWDISHSIWNARAQVFVTMRMVHSMRSWSHWSCQP